MTRTHVNLWDHDDVDRVFREANKVLKGDLERRRAHISKRNQLAMDARIKLLHGTWAVFLEPAPEQ